MRHRPRKSVGWVAAAVIAAGLPACNAAVGVGVVALLGGTGYLASQCYDRVRVRVRDPDTGEKTCSADVWVSDGDSERRLRPCYSAALTEGKWLLTARRAGYTSASAEVVVKERDGECPNYTHTVELTLRPEGEPSVPATVTPTRTVVRPSHAAQPPSGASSQAPLPAGAPAPAPDAPAVPTRSFEDVAPAADAGAPR